MDHEPGYVSVGPFGDLGSVPWPLSPWPLSVDSLGKRRLCHPWMGGYDAFDITAQCAHTGIVTMGIWEEKLDSRRSGFLEVLNIAFHFHVCLTNVSDSLETARKGVSDGDHPSMECFNFLLLLATMVWFSEVQFQETKGSSVEVSQICMVLGRWMGICHILWIHGIGSRH